MKKNPQYLFGKLIPKRAIDQTKKPWRSGTSLLKSSHDLEEPVADDADFFPLKEASRTNLDDVSSRRGKIRKRTALKQSKSEKNLSNSRIENNNRFSMNQNSFSSKKNSLLSINTISAKDFLSNLKSLGKIHIHA